MFAKTLTLMLMPLLSISGQVIAMPPGPGPHGGPGMGKWPSFVIGDVFHRPRPKPMPRFYIHSSLPSGVAFVALAGITYAIIDGIYYYRMDGDRYVYVESPPVGTYRVIEKQTSENGNLLEPGTIVSQIPANAKQVQYQGKTYFVVGENWYVAIADDKQYVVVNNPLL